MKKSEEDQLSPAVKKIWPELKVHALKRLEANCRATESRLDDSAKAYAKRVVDSLQEPSEESLPAYVKRAKAKITKLIAENEQKTHQLETETDWKKALLVVIAAATKKYGKQVLDREMRDWVQEAAVQFIERSRHFRADRRIKLTTWLFHTVRSNINHAYRDAKKQPQHLRIVKTRPAQSQRADCIEEHLLIAKDDPPDDEDDDDADLHRRRPSPSTLLPGAHRPGQTAR